jgi:hypothetical protein
METYSKVTYCRKLAVRVTYSWKNPVRKLTKPNEEETTVE